MTKINENKSPNLLYHYAWHGETAKSVAEFIESEGNAINEEAQKAQDAIMEEFTAEVIECVPSIKDKAEGFVGGMAVDDTFYEKNGVLLLQIRQKNLHELVSGEAAERLYHASEEANAKIEAVKARVKERQAEMLSSLTTYGDGYDAEAVLNNIDKLVRFDGTFLERCGVLLMFINTPPVQGGSFGNVKDLQEAINAAQQAA